MCKCDDFSMYSCEDGAIVSPVQIYTFVVCNSTALCRKQVNSYLIWVNGLLVYSEPSTLLHMFVSVLFAINSLILLIKTRPSTDSV